MYLYFEKNKKIQVNSLFEIMGLFDCIKIKLYFHYIITIIVLFRKISLYIYNYMRK